MVLKLYTGYPGNKNAYKALIAAEYNGIKLEQPAMQMGVTNKTPEFLKLNPFGKVPTLETPEGGIFESNSIARYIARLADKGLYGATTYEAGQIEQWIDYSSNELDAPMLSWLLPHAHIWPYDKKKEEAAVAAVKASLAVLDSTLAGRTFLVGHHVTLADIVLTCNLYMGFTRAFDPAFCAAYPNVKRYFETMVHQPHFAKVLGKVTLCSTPPVYAPAAAGSAAAAPKPAAAAPAAKPAAAAAAAKPAAKKAAKDDEDDGPEDYADEKPKEKNPLDCLPPSTMVLDSWKRLYSNAPASKFRDVACKGFWEGGKVPNSLNEEVFAGFDPAGYCAYFCDFKYNEENTKNFTTLNKVGGFLQRCDCVRKWAFGVMLILKKDPPFDIRGLWVFRGQGIPETMKHEVDDLELYTWTRADTKDPKVRKRIDDYFCQDDVVDGLPLFEAKVFK